MTKTPRWLCALLVVALAFPGPLGALAPSPADAQTSSATAPPPPPPPPGTAYAGERPPEDTEPTPGDRIGAGFANVAFIPGKVIMCTVGTAATIGLMLLTFGTAVRAAKDVWREGCSGDWIVRGEHISGKVPLRPEVN